MFYCEDCRKEREWPTGLLGRPTSFGPCELCKKVTGCYEVPSHWISLMKKKES